MNISRFLGATNREVMRQVRLALGPDALIISNRRVNGGVEVMASDATAVPAQAHGDSAADGAALASAHANAVVANAATADASSAPASAVADSQRAVSPPAAVLPMAPQEDVMAAISALHGMLETRIEGLTWGENLRRVPMAATLYRQLLGAGFSTALLRAMLQRLPTGLDLGQALAWVRKELLTHLPVLRDDDQLLAQGGVFALVGPTGVGKTTTLAKLAARCVKRVGPHRVLMITTDNYRIGAHEQLQIYGGLMGVPVLAVQDGIGLRQALADTGERHIVLIDNVGISQRDQQVSVQATMLCGAGRPVRKLLVLNAASQGDTLDEVAHAYRSGEADDVVGCIITKLDEATQIGAVLDTAIRHRLPVHYASQGQKVPEDLTLPRASDLVDQALAGLATRRVLYAPNEADLAALWSGSRPGRAGNLSTEAEQARTRQLLRAALDVRRCVGDEALAADGLDEALAWMASDTACQRARQLWRRSGPQWAAAHLPEQLAALEEGYASACQHHLLAVHARQRLALQAGQARAHVSLMLGDTGTALVSTLQQLTLAHGELRNWAGTQIDSAQARVEWLARHAPRLPIVHVFDNEMQLGTALTASDEAAWLVRCTATRCYLHESSRATAQGIAGSLAHVPLPITPRAAALASARRDRAGDPGGGSIWWAAQTEVGLGPRRVRGRCFRLISLRQVDDASGRLLGQYYGLCNLDPDEADLQRVASWLLLCESARVCPRLISQSWSALGAAQQTAASWPEALALSTQLALAAWQVRHAAGAASLRQVVRQMNAGAAGVSGDRKLIASLLKLFALMEMSPVSSGHLA